jgi:hypothetical protein
VAFDEIAAALKTPAGASERFKKLNALDRLLNGTFFDDIQYAFENELLGDQYLPLTSRRPSVKDNLARIVIEQSSGSLWSDDEMAHIVVGVKSIEATTDDKDQKNVDAIVNDCELIAVMMELYWKSASGCGATILDFDPDTRMPTFQCVEGKYLRPHWTSKGSNKLEALEYVYDTTAKDLRAAGVDIATDEADANVYWMRVLYTDKYEIHYQPLDAYHYQHLGETDPDDNYKVIAWLAKPGGVYAHKWGAVPAIYVRCLLFGENDDDGRCPFADIADIQVEVSRLLSQVGRGFRYAADPLLVRERGEIGMATKGMAPSGLDIFGGDEMRGAKGQTIRSVSNVLEGQAKLLEITGTGLQQAVEYTERLRELALETAGALKATGRGGKSEMSGRALGMLSNLLAILVKQQRIAYGQRALLPLIRLLLTGCKTGIIKVEDVVTPDPTVRLRLVWPKDSVDAEMLLEEHRGRMHALKIQSGAEVPNEWRDEDGQPPLLWGNQPYLPGHGPWTGGSADGTKPDDSAAVPEDHVGAKDGADPNSATPAVATPPKSPALGRATTPGAVLANDQQSDKAKARRSSIGKTIL